MLYTDEDGLTQAIDRQERSWNEANGDANEAPDDGFEPGEGGPATLRGLVSAALAVEGAMPAPVGASGDGDLDPFDADLKDEPNLPS